MRKIFNDFHPLTKLVFDVMMILIVAITFFFIGTFLLSLIKGISFQEILKISGDINGDIATIKQSQVVYSLSIFFFPSLIIAYFFDKNPLNFYKLNNSGAYFNYLNVIFLIIISVPIVNYLSQFNSGLNLPASFSGVEKTMREMEDKAKILTERLLNVSSIEQLLLNIFVIALIPAIGEELFFRGLIQKHLAEWFKNIHIAIFVTAIVFSVFHFQFFTFLPRVFLGIMLGYLFVWSKSLWLSIVAHFVNNAFAITAFYFMMKKGVPVEKIENF
ncbi:MAG: CPBP family intramembrane glutamic endopeptidase, partial [Bacteroidota bacterium]|nr:CPBP family intramembrane glutamic endopeptidase [Bacteroidota bacterium]